MTKWIFKLQGQFEKKNKQSGYLNFEVSQKKNKDIANFRKTRIYCVVQMIGNVKFHFSVQQPLAYYITKMDLHINDYSSATLEK